jgi:peroxiredoxin
VFGKIFGKLMRTRGNPTVEAGQAAPPFRLDGVDGKKYALTEALARGPVLAAFFKVACPTCQYTFPFIERIFQQLRSAGAKDFEVWGICQDNASHSREFAKEYGITFPVLLDDEPYALSQEYGLQFVPTLFLIAPDGRVEIASDGFSKIDLLSIQRRLAEHKSVQLPALFQPREKVPEFKPG